MFHGQVADYPDLGEDSTPAQRGQLGKGPAAQVEVGSAICAVCDRHHDAPEPAGDHQLGAEGQTGVGTGKGVRIERKAIGHDPAFEVVVVVGGAGRKAVAGDHKAGKARPDPHPDK